MTNGCYIVPKKPNRFLIGATSDFDNYSVGNTDDGIHWLLEKSSERIPALAHSKIIKQWSACDHTLNKNYRLWIALMMVYLPLLVTTVTVFYCHLLLAEILQLVVIWYQTRYL